jgi:hypothetical protein
MDIQSQMIEAQFEHKLQAEIDGSETPRAGRAIYATDTRQAYIGDGSEWKQITQATSLGDVKTSMLHESVFLTIHGPSWILADGRPINGSDYSNLTGILSAPDLRGQLIRGYNGDGSYVNSARVDGKQNPDSTGLGVYQADQVVSHNHSVPTGAYSAKSTNNPSGFENDYYSGTNTGSTGGNETRGKSVTVNYFIKIYT